MNQREFIRARILARKLAMQAIYQWQVSGSSLDEIKLQFQNDEFFNHADSEFFETLIDGCQSCSDTIKQRAETVIGRSLHKVDPIERSILYIAIYEILYILDVDVNTTITEAVHLAKKFGAEKGYRFINGVLDKISQGDKID